MPLTPRRDTPDVVLRQRALNRALLARQLLLRRERRDLIETIEHLVGVQAQAPSNPYVALWARLDGFQPDELSQAIAARRAVRTTLMRATIHRAQRRRLPGAAPGDAANVGADLRQLGFRQESGRDRDR